MAGSLRSLPALTCALALTLLASSASGACDDDGFRSYRKYALRGDLIGATTLGSIPSDQSRSLEGFGGGFRARSRQHAWQLDFGVLRGIQDASTYLLPVSLRAVRLFAGRGRELFVAPGLSYARLITPAGGSNQWGAELGLGWEHRIEDDGGQAWNRFILEMVLSVRRSARTGPWEEGWEPMIMLRIGMATTIGYIQY